MRLPIEDFKRDYKLYYITDIAESQEKDVDSLLSGDYCLEESSYLNPRLYLSIQEDFDLVRLTLSPKYTYTSNGEYLVRIA